MQKLKYLDSAKYIHHDHGKYPKDLFVLHETVSPDVVGWSDIINVETYLDGIGYDIHGMTDLEGNIAWALGHDKDIMYQCGGVNERSVGCEQVSNIPTLIQHGLTMTQASALWTHRKKQLEATAKLIAAWHTLDPHHQIIYSEGLTPGITTHWDVSQHFKESEGHTDCHPHHKGGYYPVLYVIQLARNLATVGYHF